MCAMSEKVISRPIQMFLSLDFLAKTLATPGSAKAFKKALAAAYGSKLPVLLARYDPHTSSWRMSPEFLLLTGYEFLPTLPAWGMTVGGSLYLLPKSERRTFGSVGSAWPTPQSQVIDATHANAKMTTTGRLVRESGLEFGLNLASAVQLWPSPVASGADNRTVGNGILKLTSSGSIRRQNADLSTSNLGLSRTVLAWSTPTVNDSKNNAAISQRNRRSSALNVQAVFPTPTESEAATFEANEAKRIAEPLNPAWVSQLMGYPDGWLDGLPDPVKRSTNGKRLARSKAGKTNGEPQS